MNITRTTRVTLRVALMMAAATALSGCGFYAGLLLDKARQSERQAIAAEKEAREKVRQDRIAATNARFEALERKQAEEKLARQVAAKAAYDAARQASADAARDGVQSSINSSVAQDIGSQVISTPISHGDF